MKKLLKVILLIVALLAFIWVIGTKKDIPVEQLKPKYANEDSKFVEIDGMNVHYRIIGKGKPVVLIPGTGSCLQSWDGWVAQMKDSFQIISLDMPGFGLTGPRQDGNYKVAEYVNFLDKFLQNLKIDSFALGGNSLGGEIAWNYAIKYPQKVSRLVLVDPGGFHNPDKGFSLVFNVSKIPFLANIFKKFDTKWMVKNTLKECFYDDKKLTDSSIQMYYDMSMREGNRTAFVDRVQMIGKEQFPDVAQIAAPTLLMWGRYDQLIDISMIDSFKTIPILETKIYENAGHVPQEEIPLESAKDAMNFLLKN
jgi:pimeloyl-ACP methyl ester carboxylesterase